LKQYHPSFLHSILNPNIAFHSISLKDTIFPFFKQIVKFFPFSYSPNLVVPTKTKNTNKTNWGLSFSNEQLTGKQNHPLKQTQKKKRKKPSKHHSKTKQAVLQKIQVTQENASKPSSKPSPTS
jgi:hypothetical protein